jgi:hypothetical protein
VLRYAPHLDKCMGKNKTVRSGPQRKANHGSGGTNNNKATTKVGVGNGVTKVKAPKPARRANRNVHPESHLYYFPPSGPMTVRIKTENGGEGLQLGSDGVTGCSLE